MKKKKAVPVTILCGFLGAGKTTILNALLSERQNKKIAVVVNEFGEIGIDGGLVKSTTEKMIELSNGCICCTLRGDLIEGIDEILTHHSPDAIIIESTGIGEPLPIAQTFYIEPELLALNPDLPHLNGRAYVDAIITVIDSSQFLELYNRQGLIPNDDNKRGFGQLLAEQVEGADIILCNKTDLTDEQTLLLLEDFLVTINPRAEIYFTQKGEVDADLLLGQRLFNLAVAEQQQAWLYELSKDEISSESEEYGISTFIFTSERPFDENKLIGVLEKGLPANILRSKGLVSLHGTTTAFLWNQAGKQLSFQALGTWANPDTAKTEVVFIGTDLHNVETSIVVALQEALIH